MFYRVLVDSKSEDGETIWLCNVCILDPKFINEDVDEVIDRVPYWSEEAIGVSCDGCGFEAAVLRHRDKLRDPRDGNFPSHSQNLS